LACRLYLVTPPVFELDAFAGVLERALSGGDVACLQLRMKGAADGDVLKAAKRLMPICVKENVAFILNDRPDLAVKAGADGVHIGQSDGSYEEARRLLGGERIIGVTCHNSRHLAMTAAEAGADYVAFGAFYPTATKDAGYRAEPGILQWWNELFEVPSVAIGGITVENCAPLVDAGADFLAVCAGVWEHPKGPDAAVYDFNKAMAGAE
jgi:thiamine-phosphate pyrophosphorylase